MSRSLRGLNKFLPPPPSFKIVNGGREGPEEFKRVDGIHLHRWDVIVRDLPWEEGLGVVIVIGWCCEVLEFVNKSSTLCCLSWKYFSFQNLLKLSILSLKYFNYWNICGWTISIIHLYILIIWNNLHSSNNFLFK